MELNNRSLIIDFDLLEKSHQHDPNLDEELTIKSAIINIKDPIDNDMYNYRMNRFSALKSLQRHVFKHECAIFFELLHESEDYTRRHDSYWGTKMRLLKKEGKPSCITGSQSLQLVLNLQKE